MDLRGRLLFPFIISVLISSSSFGQESFRDTIRVTLPEVESMFLKGNLSLLSEKYNIDASKAQVIQEQLFNNPTLIMSQSLYNPDTKKWLDAGKRGEIAVQYQQLFLLAGKRNKRIKMAELTAKREEQNYFDMLRTLKYSLRSGFYNIYYLNESIKIYEKEESSLENLINAFESQYSKGFISKNEVMRLKATLFTLQNEKLGFLTQLISALSDLNLLMHTSNVFYIPVINKLQSDKMIPETLHLQTIIDTALISRYDLRMAQSNVELKQLNLEYQKAMAIPDVTMSAGWDKSGGYVKNYNSVGMQIDLPFFNRNQGGIKAAKMDLEGSKVDLLSAGDKVKAEVIQAYTVLNENNSLFRKFDKKYIEDMDGLMNEIVKNFTCKNISLIEFLNYYDAYKQNKIQFNTLQYNRINALENLNFSVGKDLLIQN